MSARAGNSNLSVTRASSFPEQTRAASAINSSASFPETDSSVYSHQQQNVGHIHPERSVAGFGCSSVSSDHYSLPGAFSKPYRTTQADQSCGLDVENRLSGAEQIVPTTTGYHNMTSSVKNQTVPVTSGFDVPSSNTAFQDAFDILSKLEAVSSAGFVSTCVSDIPFTYSHSHSPSQSALSEQPSTSSGIKGQDTHPSWYSILTELEPYPSRQGAESTSGTPTIGTPKLAEDDVALPTVLYDVIDSTDSSDG